MTILVVNLRKPFAFGVQLELACNGAPCDSASWLKPPKVIAMFGFLQARLDLCLSQENHVVCHTIDLRANLKYVDGKHAWCRLRFAHALGPASWFSLQIAELVLEHQGAKWLVSGRQTLVFEAGAPACTRYTAGLLISRFGESIVCWKDRPQAVSLPMSDFLPIYIYIHGAVFGWERQ